MRAFGAGRNSTARPARFTERAPGSLHFASARLPPYPIRPHQRRAPHAPWESSARLDTRYAPRKYLRYPSEKSRLGFRLRADCDCARSAPSVPGNRGRQTLTGYVLHHARIEMTHRSFLGLTANEFERQFRLVAIGPRGRRLRAAPTSKRRGWQMLQWRKQGHLSV